MKNNNNGTIRNMVEEMCESHAELENFHRRTMERVNGMLVNAKEFKLPPLVLDHLNAIKDLGNSYSVSVSLGAFKLEA